MAKAGVKQKRTVLTIKKKVEILDKFKSCNASKLARDCSVGISTVCDLKKNEDKIRSFLLTTEWKGNSKKRIFMAAYEY